MQLHTLSQNAFFCRYFSSFSKSMIAPKVCNCILHLTISTISKIGNTSNSGFSVFADLVQRQEGFGA